MASNEDRVRGLRPVSLEQPPTFTLRRRSAAELPSVFQPPSLPPLTYNYVSLSSQRPATVTSVDNLLAPPSLQPGQSNTSSLYSPSAQFGFHQPASQHPYQFPPYSAGSLPTEQHSHGTISAKTSDAVESHGAGGPPTPISNPTHGPVLSNVNNPNGQLSVLGIHPGMMPEFNSGHAAAMPHFLGHRLPQQPAANDRPFKCDRCPQSFNRNHDLKRHVRIHLAVKPFPCNHCEMSFSRKDALKRHILVKGCGKITAHSKNTKREDDSLKEAVWTMTSDFPRSPQSELLIPGQKDAISNEFKSPDQINDEDLYTSSQELTVANIVKVLLRIIDAAKKASVEDVGEYVEAWTGFDLSGTDLLRRLCSPWDALSNTTTRTKAVTDYVHAVLVVAQWRSNLGFRKHGQTLDHSMTSTTLKASVDSESGKDLLSKGSKELRLTSFPNSLERLWLSEVVDRTVDAFLYRWNSEHQRWLQYRWDAACAIYYCRLHVDDQRWKYLDWNGIELSGVTAKVLASSQANAAEFAGPSDIVFDGESMGVELRRRLQNRIAQRNYRKKLRARLFELEERANAKPQTGHDAVTIDLSSESKELIDPEVMVYQDADEPVKMSCICESSSDQRFIIACLKCGTWQHIACYYESAKDYMDEHRCVQCAPRLIEPKVPSSKRPANAAFSVYSSSTEYRSKRQARTLGAESSIGQHDMAGSETAYTDPTVDNDHESRYPRSIFGKESEWPSVKETLVDSERTELACNSCKVCMIRCDNRPGGCTPCRLSKTRCQTTDRTTRLASYRAKAAEASKRFHPRELERVKEISGEDGDQSANIIIECPIAAMEHDSGVPKTCLNLKAGRMSQVRKHLRRHHGVTTMYCNRCCRDYLDARLFSLHHGRNCVDPQLPPLEGIIGVRQQWRELYMSLVRMMDSTEKKTSSGSLRLLPSIGSASTSDDENRSPRSSVIIPVLEVEVGSRGLNDNPGAEGMTVERSCHCSASIGASTEVSERHVLGSLAEKLPSDCDEIQEQLPESYKWDIEYVTTYGEGVDAGCWTCSPLQDDGPEQIPLTIATAPVVLPVEHQWPPIGGVHPPPDPRPSALIDCRTEMPLETIRDIFLTFEGTLGFYILISGLLQIIVPDTFDTTWASSHLPHRYGGLKVCYITNTVEPTTLQSPVATTARENPLSQSQLSALTSASRQARSAQSLRLNDFIETRVSSMSREKFAGKIGLKVEKDGQPFLIVSTHVITEAILSKSFFGLNRDPLKRLQEDWNKNAEIWAGNAKIGTIEKSYDQAAEYYPTGFYHDVTLIRPTPAAPIADIKSPMNDIGWLSREAWSALRQEPCSIKILGPTDKPHAAKCIKCNTPSEAVIVGEGIFYNQTAAAGSKPARNHDLSTWNRFVSRAVLYRVNPDFNPPSGYSGIALYADGTREDGTQGPGIVGFQSFVQKSDHPQKFNMPEGPHLERRLKEGRVAFYGAFQVPEELRREYSIL